MKKLSILLLTLILTLNLIACAGGSSGNEIPDVFGVNYTDAISILEADGFEVNAIEIRVENFSDKLLYPLEKVDKGTVFKIDDYIIDGHGNLNKNYDVFYDKGFISTDMSIVIYYAKEDYVLVKDAPEKDNLEENTTPSTQPPVDSIVEETAPITTEAETEDATDNTIGADFKAAMDSYEKFMDEYIAFMKKYKANPSDLSILMDYASYMGKYVEFVADFEKWEEDDLNTAELAYYIEVQARVSKKLLEVA